MTKAKKIERDKKIKELIFLFITKQGFFDSWLDDYLFYQIAQTLQCSPHKVKKIWYKDIIINHRDFVSEYEY